MLRRKQGKPKSDYQYVFGLLLIHGRVLGMSGEVKRTVTGLIIALMLMIVSLFLVGNRAVENSNCIVVLEDRIEQLQEVIRNYRG